MNINLFEFAADLQNELKNSGIVFSDDGYPIFTEDMLLKEEPTYVLPIGQTYAVIDKSKTLSLRILFNRDMPGKQNMDLSGTL